MYENLKLSKIISLDLETYDPKLTKRKGASGPGVFRSKPLDFLNEEGYILGVAIGDEHGNKAYYNLGHYDCSPELRSKNLEYLKDILSVEEHIIVGQNLMYDLDWMENWAMIPVKGMLIDVGIAEALIDENQGKYNLDFMHKKYFGEEAGKLTSEIQQFCDINELKGDPRQWLWKMPHYMVETYAIQDIDMPLDLWKIQEPILIEEELRELMTLECELLRVLLLMRKNGVPIDKDIRDKNALELQDRVESTHNALKEQVGFDFNFNSTKHLAFILEQFEIPYPLTDKGNPSVTRDFLQALAKGQVIGLEEEKIIDEVKVKLGEDLSDLRRAEKILSTFVHGSYVDYLTDDDLIHCSFYNMKTDNYGTKSGRFSSANPNLQQIPSPGVDTYYGNLARQPFVPLEGHMWGKLDYSQIEYRFMAHFARGNGSDEVREAYNINPRTDYHQYIVDLTGLKRRYAKNLNFGIAYGMGAKHMSEFFQWDLGYCYDILDTYHSAAPFIKSTIKEVERLSKSRGYIKTFLNRRARLVDRNKAYTMFCRLTQGSAADLMKKGMYELYKAGIFDVITPHITVHDELDSSIPTTNEGLEAFVESKRIMETCVELKVPIIADAEIGTNWADLTELKGDLSFVKDELFKMRDNGKLIVR